MEVQVRLPTSPSTDHYEFLWANLAVNTSYDFMLSKSNDFQDQ